MSKTIEENLPDGSRMVGNGRTFLLFTSDGSVMLRHSRRGEWRALTKNFGQDVSVKYEGDGIGYALSIRDFVQPRDGFANELASLVISAIRELDDGGFEACMSRLVSVATAARRVIQAKKPAIENKRFTTDHSKLNSRLVQLARKLGREPTKAELERAFFMDSATFESIDTKDELELALSTVDYSKDQSRRVSELCEDNDLMWLPRSDGGRPKKKSTKISASRVAP